MVILFVIFFFGERISFVLGQTYYGRNTIRQKRVLYFYYSKDYRGVHGCSNMQSLRASILSYVRIRVSIREQFFARDVNALSRLSMQLHACSTSSSSSNDQIMERVVSLVKKFSSVDATKVTETADFQKDLSLDSLDRVELVMAFEQEFSVEIPDEEADKLKCCADVAKYITSGAGHQNAEGS
nr:acyl carrier protein 3, mitochondrial-like isoform X2 [Coffea arabica]